MIYFVRQLFFLINRSA